MLITFIIISFVFLITTVIASLVAVKFGRDLLLLNDNVTAAYEVIISCHKRIDEITHRPLFYDNAEIKEVLTQLTTCRDAIMHISGGLIIERAVMEQDNDE